jgi:hypothetical protein
MPHRPARMRSAVALAATAVVTTSLLTAYAAPSATAAATRGDADGKAASASRAEQQATTAVGRARAISEGRQPGDLTMALRDVANSRVALSGEERAEAEAILERPTDAGGDGTLEYNGVREATPVCSSDVCVHYVATGPNAATPAYAAVVLDTLTDVHDAYIAAGYREPKPDRGFGGDDRIDVYLGNIGVQGLYGYCTSDQPEPDRTPSTFDRWAYCALDNNYSAAEFPTNTPLENLQVTVAHEYFHATQYAYDRYEDSWLLEATATWAEDEMYDAVDDNRQYLATSQLTRPRTPLDTFGRGFHYGTWSFFRFLTERFRAEKGSLPRLVLDIFRKADGAKGKPDQYSWQAVNSVLRAKHTTAAAMLGSYAVANRRPGRAYSEGRANRYPTAPLAGNVKIGPRRGATSRIPMKHLTTATVRLTPRNLGARTWRLRIRFDLAPRVRGSSALLTTFTRGGDLRTTRVRLDRQGDATKRIPFSARSVSYVEVTLVNGSGRFRCFTSPGNYSCRGNPLDDGVVNGFSAMAVR